MLRRIIDEARLISPTIFFVCTAYVCIGAALFSYFGDLSSKWGGLCSNIFAGSIDTFLGIILVNYIIARNQRNSLHSLKYAAFREAVGAVNLLRLTWLDMVIASASTIPAAGDNLLEDKFVDVVASNLNLDAPSGLPDARWLARASAAGIRICQVIDHIVGRYSPALSPPVVQTCLAFESSVLISGLSKLVDSQMVYLDQGLPIGSPFLLTHAKKNMIPVSNFISLVHSLAEEFKGEPGYIQPASFLFSNGVYDDGLCKLGSARLVVE